MFKKFSKYGVVAALTQAILWGATFVLVEFCRVPAALAYGCVLGLLYVINFFVLTRFVFESDANAQVATKYIFSLVGFWVLNNLSFNGQIHFFHISYKIAVIVNMILFALLRFFFYQKVVFTQKRGSAVSPDSRVNSDDIKES